MIVDCVATWTARCCPITYWIFFGPIPPLPAHTGGLGIWRKANKYRRDEDIAGWQWEVEDMVVRLIVASWESVMDRSIIHLSRDAS